MNLRKALAGGGAVLCVPLSLSIAMTGTESLITTIGAGVILACGLVAGIALFVDMVFLNPGIRKKE